MALLAEVVGRRAEGLAVSIDANAHIARVFEDHECKEAAFDISYPFQSAPRHPESNYYVALFGHSNWLQARAMTLRVNEKPVGAIFPLEVLCSGFADNIEDSTRYKATMEEYAAIAFSKMCKGEIRGRSLAPIIPATSAPLQISTFYHPDTVVAILTIDEFFPLEVRQAQDSEEYDRYFIRYLPSFYRQGLFPSPRELAQEETAVPTRYRQFNGAISGTNGRNLALEPLSDYLVKGSREFLLTVLQEIDPNEHNPFFRFFLYYQVFELWMQEIYVDAITAFTGALASGTVIDTIIFREKLQVLNTTLNEKNRLGQILTANPCGECGPLVLDACNEVLALCGQPPIAAVHEALYSVRNRLVHSFSQTKAARHEFEKLADATLDLICRTAVQYRQPPATLF